MTTIGIGPVALTVTVVHWNWLISLRHWTMHTIGERVVNTVARQVPPAWDPWGVY